MKYRLIALFISLLLVNCGPKKGIITKKADRKEVVEVKDKTKETSTPVAKDRPNTSSSTKSKVDTYIETYANIAKDNMRSYKVPASITLAQGILESGSGRGRLAVKANNHFGIKCHGWKGAKIYHDDDRSQECFRKYKKAESSYNDHSKFLTGRKRYSNLFKLKPNDYKGWAKGLRAAGYATDRKYPQKLISLIERYKLYEYDNEVLGGVALGLGKDPVIEVKYIKHTVVEGDTLYSLSRRYGLTVDQLKNANNLSSNHIAIGQVLVIKPN